MNDLISRQAAIDALKNQMSDWNDDYNVPVRKSIENIERLPSAQPEITMEDVEEYCRKRCLIVITNELFHQMRAKWSQPEIVRCKDCKYWDTSWQNDYAPNYHYCPLVDGTRREDFYCADAERRTE